MQCSPTDILQSVKGTSCGHRSVSVCCKASSLPFSAPADGHCFVKLIFLELVPGDMLINICWAPTVREA